MSRIIAVLIVAAVAAAALLPLSVPAEAQSADALNLTVRNITAGQPITPPIAVVHDAGTTLLPQNADSLDGLEELAEAGAQSALAASLGEIDGVKGVFSLAPPPILPGEEVTADIAASPGDHVSVIAMLACTNDAITIGTLVVSESGRAMSSGRVYDAGTEDNTETAATVPCLGGESAGVSDADSPDGEGRIAHHQGIAGGADLTAEQHGWDNVAMQLFLSDTGDVPAGVEFGLTIDNLTLGQPITPPLAVVHDPNVDVLVYDSPNELEGIADLAEGGARDALAATLRTRPGVVAVKNLEAIGPIPAGTSLIADATGVLGAHVSVVGMFACTNDGYILATLPLDGTANEIRGAMTVAAVIDSGSEANDETAATVPCLGGGPAAFSPGLGEGSRSVHPGISGGADLDPMQHGWTAGTTARVSIHEPGRSQVLAPPPLPVGAVATPTPAAVAVPGGPAPSLPVTGGYTPTFGWILAVGLAGALLVLSGSMMLVARQRVRRGRQNSFSPSGRRLG